MQRIKTGDNAPLTVKNNEHVLSLSGDDLLLEINKALSDKFGLEYLKSCIEQKIQKQNSQTFLNGCRKYNLSLRKQIPKYRVTNGYFLTIQTYKLRNVP